VSISLRSNLDSSRIIRLLSNNSQRLGTSYSRLSSGERINSSKDDPSGQNLSDSLRLNSTVKTRARNNVNDGISALEIADSALTQVGTLLSRMAEVAQQGANGVLNSTQRKALDKEYSQLDQEIRRIADTTTFNGIKLLKGEKSADTAVQVSGNVNAAAGALGAAALAVSDDGLYVTFYNAANSTIQQLNTNTGQTTNIAQVSALVDLKASGNGETVIFSSIDNINGLNPSGYTQIFKYDRTNGSISKVTNSQGFDVFTTLEISADGSTVAFSSQTNYTSGSTSSSAGAFAADPDFYVANISTGIINRLGASASGVTFTGAQLSSDGSYVSFASNSNYFGTNADGNQETFVSQTNNLLGGLRQVSNSTGTNQYAAIVLNDGTAYLSSYENLTGSNPSGYGQFFKYNYAGNQLSQITNFTTGVLVSASVSNDGTLLNFSGTVNPTGENSIGTFQAFRLNLQTSQIIQTTNFSSFNSYVNYTSSKDGNSLIYTSADNYGGRNADGSTEIIKINLGSADLNLNIESGNSAKASITAKIGAVNGSLFGLGFGTLTTAQSSRGALETTLNNISNLALAQGKIGAALSRLESANGVLDSEISNLKQANGKIRDVDVAEETANLLRYNILQDTATALLAQANQQPQAALQLLNA
jgi:flagellin